MEATGIVPASENGPLRRLHAFPSIWDSLDNMPNDHILEYTESIREIMEFTEKKNEIRVMSEQSSISKAIVDVAVAGRDELDKLEEKAGG